MKTLFAMLVASFIFFSGCSKTDITPANQSVSASSQGDISILKTRSALVSAHPWMYQGYYFHYTDMNHKGDVQYERGQSKNVINLDETRYFFKSDGTFLEFDGGFRYPGTWHFTDKTATVLILNFTNWTEDCTIVKFTNNQLNYTEPMGYRDDVSFTELIPAQ
jgi:hypothetical protein